MIAVFSFAAVSCIDEIGNTDIPTAEAGDEVQFGLSLGDPATRTIYGAEYNNAFPIFWSTGDKVQIYSPQCVVGRNDAEYQVTPVASQSYAKAMTKTGDYGVQWGTNATADFYSVFPSADVVFEGKGQPGDPVTATLNISSTQKGSLVSEDNTTNGKNYRVADMNNVIMYALTSNVKSGDIANLKYTPYSTIIEFEMSVTTDETNEAKKSVLVESVTLTAPKGTLITGDFTLTFPVPSTTTSATPITTAPAVSTGENNGNVIELQFATKPELFRTDKLFVKLSLLPIEVASLDGWTVSIVTRQGDKTPVENTKTIKDTGTATKLLAGQIHKVKLPSFEAKSEWTYSPADWMTKLPEYETIYLTELSIPGAWYAGGKGYQDSDHTMASLWEAGVRAFGIECRTATGSVINTTPSYVGVSGTGTNNIIAELDHYWNADKLSDLILQLSNKVKDSGEFAVMVINYAYGAKGGYRDQDFKFFLSGVQKAIDDSGADNIAGEITPETTIEDVKDQLIIKINVDSRVSNTITDAEAMFSTVPLAHDLDGSKVYFSDLKYGSWTEGENNYTDLPAITSDSFLWCFTSANRTQLDSGSDSDIPTYQDRKDALKAMIEKSKEIYAGSNHNVWFYFNAGGTQTTSLTANTNDSNAKSFASEMNPWLQNIINFKMYGGTDENGILHASDPSPLGIVMFNYCTNTTYGGPAIVQSIIEMNNKFDLKHYTNKAGQIVPMD